MQQQDSDNDLLAGLRIGDPVAFRGMVDRHARRLLGLAYTVIGNRADAEDLVQETFIGAIGSIGRFKGDSSLRTWLSSILVRQASKMRRRPANRATSMPEGLAVPDHKGGSGVQQQVAAKMDLLTMLDTLTPEHREILVLRELEGLSYDELATALSVPRGTVESRLHRARQKLIASFPGYIA